MSRKNQDSRRLKKGFDAEEKKKEIEEKNQKKIQKSGINFSIMNQCLWRRGVEETIYMWRAQLNE